MFFGKPEGLSTQVFEEAFEWIAACAAMTMNRLLAEITAEGEVQVDALCQACVFDAN